MGRLAMVIAVGVALTFALAKRTKKSTRGLGHLQKDAMSYEDMSAAKKLKYLWGKVMKDTTPGSFMDPAKTVPIIEKSDNLKAMTKVHSDWRAVGHQKVTHGLGAVAKAHFKWKKNEYSGMFQQADNCVIRMANAAPPTAGFAAYGPNLAVKCLRDGLESANMLFIWELDGYAVRPQGAQQSCSYFETPIANHNPIRDDLAAPLKHFFCPAFQAIDPHSMWSGLSQMAWASQNGTEVTPHFPFALVLKPAEGLNKVPCTFSEPNSQLLNIDKSKKTLYEIYASHDPLKGPTSSLEMIGSLVLDTPFTPSRYADTELFFRHTFWNDEMKQIELVDPARAAKWSAYAKQKNINEIEGAHLYWPLLPGGKEEMAKLAAKPQMLSSDDASA